MKITWEKTFNLLDIASEEISESERFKLAGQDLGTLSIEFSAEIDAVGCVDGFIAVDDYSFTTLLDKIAYTLDPVNCSGYMMIVKLLAAEIGDYTKSQAAIYAAEQAYRDFQEASCDEAMIDRAYHNSEQYA